MGKECLYKSAPNRSRMASLKLAHEQLKGDLVSLLEMHQQLRSGSKTEVSDLLERIRSGPKLNIDVDEYDASVQAGPENVPPISPTTETVVGSSSLGDSVRQITSTESPSNDVDAIAHNASIDVVLDEDPSTSREKEPSQADEPTVQHSIERNIRNVLHSQLPGLRSGFSSFRKCTSMIFFAYTEDEFDNLVANTINEQDLGPSRAALCELCGIGAIASRYDREQLSPDFGDYCYNVAKQLLDDCLEMSPLASMKVCALLGLVNLLNKATVALAYLGK